ncbi:uracil-DNA glycosylase family 4 [Actinoplanes octamycinicus]|uniref:Type-5 uracil-DNA glycosylase n=1 Tax=Actinoplanes octamycinicus TaxID=135948 RepID=A0A7W7GVC5_9ACTN|nr:uracil-DNA glycosylase [Actinoplanes octamycinicus]MBB4738986.1 uracil-DNA glycosylase family 4 [Actinoplanes octamycinicus]GIE60115.1 uracil-DNA glycosylase [Actinoplanes octamycinicus]
MQPSEGSPRTPEGVAAQAAAAASLTVLDARVADCFACPRLVAWRTEVATVKRASFRDQDYWGRPVPGMGPADASIAILGLAPAAHGGNRTGRIFTGDRSGDVLFAALHRAGLANQPTSVAADDGLELRHTRIFAAVRCAPPDNKPTPGERDTCAPWFHRELTLIRPTLKAVVTLGAFAWTAWWPAMQSAYGVRPPVPRPKFGHGAEVHLPGVPPLLGCFHVSQQNTFTGRLTPAMLDDVFTRAKVLAGLA